MSEEKSKLFLELQEKREQQLTGLRQAFETSFGEYWKDRKKRRVVADILI